MPVKQANIHYAPLIIVPSEVGGTVEWNAMTKQPFGADFLYIDAEHLLTRDFSQVARQIEMPRYRSSVAKDRLQASLAANPEKIAEDIRDAYMYQLHTWCKNNAYLSREAQHPWLLYSSVTLLDDVEQGRRAPPTQATVQRTADAIEKHMAAQWKRVLAAEETQILVMPRLHKMTDAMAVTAQDGSAIVIDPQLLGKSAQGIAYALNEEARHVADFRLGFSQDVANRAALENVARSAEFGRFFDATVEAQVGEEVPPERFPAMRRYLETPEELLAYAVGVKESLRGLSMRSGCGPLGRVFGAGKPDEAALDHQFTELAGAELAELVRNFETQVAERYPAQPARGRR